MRTVILICSLILLSCVPGSKVKLSQLTHAKDYQVIFEEPTSPLTEKRTMRRFDITSPAVTFEERCQTAMRAAIELNKKYSCDLTSIVIIPAPELKTSGICYARADYATDHKGVLGIPGTDPALPGWDWFVSGSERILTEKELSIAKLFFTHMKDFPSRNVTSNLSYDPEALKAFVARKLNLDPGEIVIPNIGYKRFGVGEE